MNEVNLQNIVAKVHLDSVREVIEKAFSECDYLGNQMLSDRDDEKNCAGKFLFVACIGGNEPKVITDAILEDYLFYGCEDKLDFIAMPRQLEIVAVRTIGNSSNLKDYTELKNIMNQLDGRLSLVVYRGLEAYVNILRGFFDASDIKRAVEFLDFVSENEAQFYQDKEEEVVEDKLELNM